MAVYKKHPYPDFFKLFNYFIPATFAYGFTRAVTYRREDNNTYYNKKTGFYEVKPILFTDRPPKVLWYSFAAVFGWPAMVMEDLKSMECFVRGKDPKEYQ